MPKLTDEQLCPSLAEYWTRGANRFRLYIRCEAGAGHQGKHRNKHGKSWRDNEAAGFIEFCICTTTSCPEDCEVCYQLPDHEPCIKADISNPVLTGLVDL